MPVSRKDGRRLTGYIGDINPAIDNDEELPTNNQHYEEEEEEEIVEEVEEDRDDTSSELSIPDAEIDFDMVYALYTFAATVEGQASIVKGDALTLLDDSNSYWWLVKVLKTAEVGYIPAEIIETPYERLARLNSHRNAQLTRPENVQAIIQTSTIRKTPKSQKRVTLAKAVQFQSQIMFNLEDDEEEFEVEYNDWKIHIHHGDEDDSGSDSEESTSTIGSDPDPYHFYGDEEDEDEEIDDRRKQEGEVVQNQQENDYPIFNSPVNEEFDTHLTPLKDTAEEESELKVNNSQQQQQQLSSNNNNHNNTSDNNNHQHQYQHQHEHHTNNNNSSSSNNTQSVIKIYASHDFKESNFIEFTINNHTTTNDLIDQAIDSFDIYDIDEKDYFLGVKNSMSGDDYTLIPTDKPLDIYHSLGTNAPMPNLKKAKRISQLMTPDGHIGSAIVSKEQDVKFYLYSKPRRMEDDGEIQIKVSLDNFHKLIKITPTIPVNEATGFLLEKFHVLDGLAVGSDRNSLGMGSQDVVTYQLYLYDDKKEYALPSSATLAEVLGNQMPPIQYRRHSNLNRLSIAININPPNENETYFILKPIQKPIQKPVEKPIEKAQQLSQQQADQRQHQNEDRHQQQEEIQQQEEEDHQQQNLQQQQSQENLNHQQLNHEHSNETSTPIVHHHPIRHDTPMPRRDNSPISERSISDKPPQIILTSDSPVNLGFESPEPIISNKRPKSTNSMIFHNDFGMQELMILIREKSRPEPKPRKSTIANLRGEITNVFKESHGRLDQLEKELDDILAIAINMP